MPWESSWYRGGPGSGHRWPAAPSPDCPPPPFLPIVEDDFREMEISSWMRQLAAVKHGPGPLQISLIIGM